MKWINQLKDIFFYKIISKNIYGYRSILDVGCGQNSSLRFLLKNIYSEGIDIHKPSIEKSKKRKIHNKYIVEDIRKLDEYYKSKSFDAVVAIDVIEHFKKKDARQLLEKMEKVARKKVIILTPNGFCHQDHYDQNPYQHHKSGWHKKNFEKCGYKVYGLRSFKFIRGEYATIKYKPWIVWGIIAFITEPLLYYFPSLSYQLLAVKTLNEEK